LLPGENSITSGHSGRFSIHLRLREPASNEETDFAVECVSVKHWVIVVGFTSGSGILPTQVPGQGALPSLAPMLEKVLPAV
jgi:hypothetical protein